MSVVLFACSCAANAATCHINDVATLMSCMQYKSTYDTFQLTNDVVCGQGPGNSCCSGANSPLLDFNNFQNKILDGNGHRLTRLAQQKACPAIQVSGASNIQISNLTIDENGNVPPCGPFDGCAPTIEIVDSTDITLNGVHINDGKGNSVNAWGVNGLNFLNSSISNAGVIGLYVGHAVYRQSYRLQVRNSVFAGARANGLAIEGAGGTSPTDNVIANNVFNRNHHHGLWSDGNGGLYNGGQLYLARASNLTVANNTFGDGRCFNCSTSQIWAVEFGTANSADGMTLSNIQLSNNYIFNHLGVGFFLNPNSPVDGTLQISGNKVFGVTSLSNFTSLNLGSNNVGDAPITLSHEGLNGYELFRLNGAFHFESSWAMPNTVQEARMALSLSPRPGARRTPIYRCVQSTVAQNDFPSLDANCEGQVLHSILGYSFEPGHPGAQAFYRCRVGSDHFASWDPGCEGQVVDGPLGYAVPR